MTCDVGAPTRVFIGLTLALAVVAAGPGEASEERRAARAQQGQGELFFLVEDASGALRFSCSHRPTKVPVIGGAEDGPNFPEIARNAAEALQNAELVLIPNVGHNPHLEAAEILNRELIRFLSSDPDTPAATSW